MNGLLLVLLLPVARGDGSPYSDWPSLHFERPRHTSPGWGWEKNTCIFFLWGSKQPNVGPTCIRGALGPQSSYGSYSWSPKFLSPAIKWSRGDCFRISTKRDTWSSCPILCSEYGMVPACVLNDGNNAVLRTLLDDKLHPEQMSSPLYQGAWLGYLEKPTEEL